MGYAEIDRAFGTAVEKDRFLCGVVELSCKLRKQKVIKSAMVGRIWYAACEVTYPDSPPVVIALVYPTISNGRDRKFSWRPNEEGSVEGHFDCPAGIMSLLSPLDQLQKSGINPEWVRSAREWREGVREVARQKSLAARERNQIKDGTVLLFANPLKFKGTDIEVAEAIARRAVHRGKNTFICEALGNPDFRFNLSKSIIERAALAPEALPAKSSPSATPPAHQAVLPMPGLAA